MTNPTSTTIIQHQNPLPTIKKQKLHHHTTAENHRHPQQPLLPGLPDHLSQLCLSLLPPSTLFSVCHSWRRLLYTPSFPPFLSLYTLLIPTHPHHSNAIQFASFDPVSNQWHHLPPPPLRLLFRHPSFISRKLPIQSLSVAGKLLLLAATTDHFLPALPKPLLLDPATQKWTPGPPLWAPRRWCAAGTSGSTVYVASGVGAHYDTNVARSVEKLEFGAKSNQKQMKWEKMGSLKDGKFSREAIESVGWRGKLCMVNVKGDAAKEGIIYDVESDQWEEMPEGMLAGWRGPAAAMEEKTIYMVDESKGSLKRYDCGKDSWVEVLESHELLKGAQQVVAASGKVCILSRDGGCITVVDVADRRVWVVEAPEGLQGVGIHVLPRLSPYKIDFEV